ncbi:MAG: CoxG family protein [Myxococcota bacterium]
MEISGEHTFEADRSLVWQLLLDPDAIQEAIPGCEEMTPRDGEGEVYDVKVSVGISAIKGTYSGTVEVADQQPEESYRLVASGKARPGSVRGSATLELEPRDGTTVVRYHGDVQAQGAIARVGNRLLGRAAKMMIGQFFDGMDEQVKARRSS